MAGYAIPIDTALAVADQITSGVDNATIHQGVPAFLGIQTAQASSTGLGQPGSDLGQSGSDLASRAVTWPSGRLGASADATTGATTGASAGAPVGGVVSGSAADRAGITAGSTITKVGGEAIASSTDLTAATGHS